MAVMQFKLVLGCEVAAQTCAPHHQANDNSSREQDLFELSIARELVDDADHRAD